MQFAFALVFTVIIYHTLYVTLQNKYELTIIKGVFSMAQRSSQRNQEDHPQLHSNANDNTSLEPAQCPRCETSNNKKRRIKCSICSSKWHLTCVRLKRVQADALGTWWCPNCTNHSSSQCNTKQQDPSHTPSDTSLKNENDTDLADHLANLKQTRQVVQRIPRGTRIAAADALTMLIDTAVEERTKEAMTKLFQFPRIALAVPDKDVKENHSLTSKIKRQIAMYMESLAPVDNSVSDVHQDKRRVRPRARSDIDYIRRTVPLKLADGDVRGAIRLLASNDQIAEHSHEVVEGLKLKHPPAPSDLKLPPAPAENHQPYMATEHDVTSAVASFDTGSSAGLDGLRPAHLKDLTSKSAGEAGPRLIKALTSLVNLALRGEIPPSARTTFYGASLTALRKKDGGIRPIAVGSTYRRLATKVGLKPLSAQLGQELRPVQLGYGTPGGCEAAVHATRHFAAHLKEDSVAVKLDMRNAFNTVRRDHFLRVAREFAAPLYPLLWQAYSQPTPLYYGTTQIISATGVQQGDPCGPAVFSLAIHPVTKAASCDFNCWYLDDGTLGGEATSVCENLRRLLPAMADIGLEINSKKCEIILPENVTEGSKTSITEMVRQVIPGAAVLTDPELTILGAPISQAATEAIMANKKEELERMIYRLQNLDSHSAFFLLKNSLWLPKLQYILRAAPIYKQPELLQSLDWILKSAVSCLSNVDFDEESWRQAVLPTRYGGLGLRRTEDVALPSYVASVHSCRQLVTAMVPKELSAGVAQLCSAAAEDWQTLAGVSEPPVGDAKSQQRAWDDVLTERQWKSLLSEANQFARARLLSAATSESGAWLHATPSTSLGTMLDNDTLRIGIALRIGADLCIPHKCRCGSPADSKGYHALTCRFSAGRHPRHTALNDVIKRALQSAGIPAILEPAGLDRGDGKRPDGMTIFPYAHGKSMLWDATCVNTYAETNIALSATNSGGAAEEEETRKRRKYAGLQQRYQFEPAAFETAGACGPSTRIFIKKLGARLVASSGDRREAAWLRQRLAIAVIRGNAVSVLSTTTSKTTLISQQQLPPRAQRQQEQQQKAQQPPPPPQQQQQQQQIQQMEQPQTQQQSPPQQLNMVPPSQQKRLQRRSSMEHPSTFTDYSAPPSTPTAPAAAVIPAGSAVSTQRRLGLVNQGNTCFMNAVLQALFHSDQLCSKVLAARPSSSQPHLAALQRVFAFLAFSERSAYSPAEFHHVALPPWFELGRQHDSAEFLSYLWSAIQEEEEERAQALPVQPSAAPPTVLSVVRSVSRRASDDTSVSCPAAADRPWPRRRHRSCETSAKPSTGPAEKTEKTDDFGDGTENGEKPPDGPTEPAAGLVRRLLTGQTETTYTCCACGTVSRHVDHATGVHLTLPEALTRPLTVPASGPEKSLDVQPETELTVSDLLQLYLAPERLYGDNQYHCATCACLRDADRQLRLVTPPQHLVVSLGRFMYDRRTGARRKVLAPVGLTERLTVPMASQPAAKYRLYAVIVHAGHSLDAGHYFSFCRASDGCGDDWWRLDDTSTAPVTAATALGLLRRPTDASYVLLYRLEGAGRRPLTLAVLPGPLRAAVMQDNAVFRRDRQDRPVRALPLSQAGRNNRAKALSRDP